MEVVTIESSAPTRIADLGGWTDTWFARHGAVLHFAVEPRARVLLTARPGSGLITLDVRDYADHYSIPLPQGRYGRHPLLEAALDEIPPPPALDLTISLSCAAPPGCSTGTSAAISVALLGALDLLTPTPRPPLEIARAAHRVETLRLARECGIQDQIASALGGINLLEITAYPEASITPVPLRPAFADALAARLQLIYTGRGHCSAEVHQLVIAQGSRALDPLRAAARRGHAALLAEDLPALGRAFVANTEAQRALHPALISEAHERVITQTRAHAPCLGWKVNGAGGDGGSVTLLFADPAPPLPGSIPISLAPDGLRRRRL